MLVINRSNLTFEVAAAVLPCGYLSRSWDKLWVVEEAPSVARSRTMQAIRKKNTKPELRVRRRLHALGYRFRLHRRDLPGTPDIVLPRHGVVIQVHGCFWHQHAGCRYSVQPRTRQEYWLPKLERNVSRDEAVAAELEALGWRVLILWECELGDEAALDARLLKFI